jgi:hypothetical protein
VTISDAFAAANPAAMPDGSPAVPQERAGVHARMRARGYRSLSVLGKVHGWGAVAWADLRAAWWTPQSLPTLQQAWAGRMPDRERVPGDNALLYRGWVFYNHTVGLAVPAAVLIVLAVLIAIPSAALIFK